MLSTGMIKSFPCESYQTTDGTRITVTPVRVLTDPITHVFNVSVDNKEGVWMETFGSRAELDAFLRGLSAGASMYGRTHLSLPTVPTDEHFRVIGGSSHSDSGFCPGAQPGAD